MDRPALISQLGQLASWATLVVLGHPVETMGHRLLVLCIALVLVSFACATESSGDATEALGAASRAAVVQEFKGAMSSDRGDLGEALGEKAAYNSKHLAAFEAAIANFKMGSASQKSKLFDDLVAVTRRASGCDSPRKASQVFLPCYF